MKVVIFAGGIGSRITEESHLKPKPMIEIGEKPIIWHIMKIYAEQGYNEFIICLGYKGFLIKEYFNNYFLLNSDVTIGLKNNEKEIHFSKTEEINVTLVDTGLHTKTAGRLKRIQNYITEDEFMLTYGDGVSDINLNQLISFHRNHRGIASMTCVQPPQQFGRVIFNNDGKVTHFKEKSQENQIWINGGFFVLNKAIFKYLPENADEIMWEDEPLEMLTTNQQLYVFKHSGFWKCMDAMRDKIVLDEMWNTGSAKWKIW